jgi:ATP-binding cassette subfamily C (CFTR/MRP) protein 10
MPVVPRSLHVRAAAERLETEFKLSASKLGSPGCFEFYRCLFAAHGRGHYVLLGAVKFLVDCLGVANPFLLKRFLDWLESSSGDSFVGGLYVGLMAGIALLSALITPHYNYQIACTSLNVRSSIMVAVFQRCSAHQPEQLGTGASEDSSATNLISIDSQRVADTVSSFNELWSLPVQVALSFYLLYCEVAWSFLAGVLFMLLVVPINMLLARVIQRSTASLSAHRDQRIERMRRTLKGIRTIKSYSLERHCVNDVSSARSLEFAQLQRRKFADSGCVLFWAVTPVAVVLATVAAYCWMNSETELTTGQLFSTITLLNMLVYPFNAFPWVINGIMEARVSAARLQKFVALIPKSHPHEGDSDSVLGPGLLNPQSASTVREHRSTSDSSQVSSFISMSKSVIAACPALHRVSDRVFTIGPFSLELDAPHILAVIGPVSSGKSVFMRALAGECAVASGSLAMHANVSYSSQEPFLFDGSVLENILFGSKLNLKILNQVAASCGLDCDLKSWAGGMHYAVGPGGRCCSSGQRMRISVARALYRSQTRAAASVVVMDGPTTGLDHALVRTVLESLVTHALQGSIVCVSFASQLHFNLLMDRCCCPVTVISLQPRSPPQIFTGAAVANLAQSNAFPLTNSTAISLELRDSNSEQQELVTEEHREFGGLMRDFCCVRMLRACVEHHLISPSFLNNLCRNCVLRSQVLH